MQARKENWIDIREEGECDKFKRKRTYDKGCVEDMTYAQKDVNTWEPALIYSYKIRQLPGKALLMTRHCWNIWFGFCGTPRQMPRRCSMQVP